MADTTLTTEAPAVITGEEILVFAAGRNLPVPAVLASLPVIGMEGEALQERMIDAVRVLLTRNVSPNQPAPGVEEPPLAEMLALMCDPEVSLSVTRSEGPRMHRDDFSLRAGRAVKYTWNEIGLYALAFVPSGDVVEHLVSSTGLADDRSDRTEAGSRVVIEIPGFKDLAEKGPDAVADALAASMADDRKEAAAAIADAMDAGLPSRAVFMRADGETIGVGWFDAGVSGFWAFSLRTDGSARFEALAGADIRALIVDGLAFATAPPAGSVPASAD